MVDGDQRPEPAIDHRRDIIGGSAQRGLYARGTQMKPSCELEELETMDDVSELLIESSSPDLKPVVAAASSTNRTSITGGSTSTATKSQSANVPACSNASSIMPRQQRVSGNLPEFETAGILQAPSNERPQASKPPHNDLALESFGKTSYDPARITGVTNGNVSE